MLDNWDTDEVKIKYQEQFFYYKNHYLNFPYGVSIETRAVCNAACDFCPYPTMERKGDTMPDDLIEKIIQDITDIPNTYRLLITLARVNEPFLDKRIFDIAHHINTKVPTADLVLFSNGSPLTNTALDKLEKIQNILYLNISFNDHRSEHYEKTMKLPYARTLERIDALHDRVTSERLKFWVRISRVGDGSQADDEFIAWVKHRWPAFQVISVPRGDWIGQVNVVKSSIPDVGCTQWFTINFLADGRDTFCCIDSDAEYGHSNVAIKHLLEIYNHPLRRHLRESALSRLDVGICRECSMLS